LYTWRTPNGRKVSIALEELGLSYKTIPINIGKNEQFAPEFLAINPNSKIPAIVDHDGPNGKPITVFESGAILMYLAEKTGKLVGRNPHEKYEALQWTFWQVGGPGPMFGQLNHFLNTKPLVEYGVTRYSAEVKRLYKVLDTQLSKTGAFIIGDQLSIADIVNYPWFINATGLQINLEEYPHVKKWVEKLGQRSSFQKGMKVPEITAKL